MNTFKDIEYWTAWKIYPDDVVWQYSNDGYYCRTISHEDKLSTDDLLAEIVYLTKALNAWKRRAHLLVIDKKS